VGGWEGESHRGFGRGEVGVRGIISTLRIGSMQGQGLGALPTF
jgi:hypothetical protein